MKNTEGEWYIMTWTGYYPSISLEKLTTTLVQYEGRLPIPEVIYDKQIQHPDNVNLQAFVFYHDFSIINATDLKY